MHKEFDPLMRELPARTSGIAQTLLTKMVQYCVRHGEGAMEAAMDMVTYQSAACNKYILAIDHLGERYRVQTQLAEVNEKFNELKETLVKDLVSSGYELGPLEFECIRCAVLRHVFTTVFSNVPETWPIPARVL